MWDVRKTRDTIKIYRKFEIESWNRYSATTLQFVRVVLSHTRHGIFEFRTAHAINMQTDENCKCCIQEWRTIACKLWIYLILIIPFLWFPSFFPSKEIQLIYNKCWLNSILVNCVRNIIVTHSSYSDSWSWSNWPKRFLKIFLIFCVLNWKFASSEK